MKVSDFNYELPKELIAQHPLKKRDESRLMVLNRDTKKIENKTFKDIIDYLEPGDCLVRNNTKVIPARLYGKIIGKESQKPVEFLLLKQLENNNWEVMVRPGKKLRSGAKVEFGEGLLKAEILEVLENGNRKVHFEYNGIFNEILDQIGLMPLPPYITETLKEKDRYQTVYAKNIGSAAAPTAGLHFTKELLEEIKSIGVDIEYVTLHVGLGTFRPVTESNVLNHEMHSEFYMISKSVADKLNLAKKEGRRIIAVGTTSTRTLESNITKYGEFKECRENTSIFIYPGYEFKGIDALITNFHLPKSTLVMLVSALAGRDNILNAYKYAVDNKYRFFSFGDAMFITNDINSK